MKTFVLTLPTVQSEADFQAFLARHPDIQVEQWDSEPDSLPENDPELIAAVALALEQVKNGQTVSLEEAKDNFAKWMAQQA